MPLLWTMMGNILYNNVFLTAIRLHFAHNQYSGMTYGCGRVHDVCTNFGHNIRVYGTHCDIHTREKFVSVIEYSKYFWQNNNRQNYIWTNDRYWRKQRWNYSTVLILLNFKTTTLNGETRTSTFLCAHVYDLAQQILYTYMYNIPTHLYWLLHELIRSLIIIG